MEGEIPFRKKVSTTLGGVFLIVCCVLILLEFSEGSMRLPLGLEKYPIARFIFFLMACFGIPFFSFGTWLAWQTEETRAAVQQKIKDHKWVARWREKKELVQPVVSLIGLIVILVIIGGASFRAYIDPPEQFMRSFIVTPHGMNSFPFGNVSVAEFVSQLSKRRLVDGQYPEIQGWMDSDNGYTLYVSFGDKELEANFVHLDKTKDGSAYSGLSFSLDGEEEESGLALMGLVFG